MNDKDWEYLRGGLPEEDVIRYANNIVSKAMKHILGLEGKTRKGREQATWKAIGRRIAKLRENGVCLSGKGTPKDHNSIINCFKR